MKTIHLTAILKSDYLRIGVHTEVDIKSPIYSYEEKNIHMDNLKRIKTECLKTIHLFNMKTLGMYEFRKELESMGAMLCEELLTFDIKMELLRTDASFLIFNIDDNLVHIPWELILIDKTFLCERFNTGRVVQTHQKNIYTHKNQGMALPIKMTILVDPEGDLEKASEESETLIDTMDQMNADYGKIVVDASSDGDFSLNDVISKFRKSQFFHFAGHAIYNDKNQEQSGWKLSKEYLTVRDIDKMSFSSMPVLVFSNACQSARTEEWKKLNKKLTPLEEALTQTHILPESGSYGSRSSEHILDTRISTHEKENVDASFGMVNAFLRAGVKFYIGTNWKIFDAPGSQFAINFYHYFFKGKTIGESIRLARLSLIDQYGKESIDWASYIFYGDPRFTLKDLTLDIKKERRVDAIAPEHAIINKQIDLIIQIRLPDSPVLNVENFPVKQKPDSASQESETIELEFPINVYGGVGSASIDINVITTHFSIDNGNHKRVEIPPDKDSKPVIFYLVSKQVGCCRINVELSRDDHTYMGTIPLEITVSDDASMSIAPLTVNSLIVMFRVADENIRNIGADVMKQIRKTDLLHFSGHAIYDENNSEQKGWKNKILDLLPDKEQKNEFALPLLKSDTQLKEKKK